MCKYDKPEMIPCRCELCNEIFSVEVEKGKLIRAGELDFICNDARCQIWTDHKCVKDGQLQEVGISFRVIEEKDSKITKANLLEMYAGPPVTDILEQDSDGWIDTKPTKVMIAGDYVVEDGDIGEPFPNDNREGDLEDE